MAGCLMYWPQPFHRILIVEGLVLAMPEPGFCLGMRSSIAGSGHAGAQYLR
ncbi:hypothetical protein [Chitinophaga sp. OAE865]|uniref:hypothetical protein n=1 Tax=Chitinophaga sp. OAE865 TaxID=2817898 RepID=UPI001AE4595E